MGNGKKASSKRSLRKGPLKDRPLQRKLRETNPVMLVIYGYVIYIAIGAALLMLPISTTDHVSVLDNIFVSTSAVSTTGLTPVNISTDYDLFGQGVILVLIQFGGIGYMTFSSFVLLSTKKQLSNKRKCVNTTVFSIPKDFLIEKFLTRVVIFTAIIEAAGALGLYFAFSAEGVENPLWQAVFTSVSAFCTAGFSLLSSNMEGFSTNFYVNFILSVLSISGAIGFIVFVDVFNKLTGKKEQLSFTTRIIIRTTIWILVIGTFIMVISEGSLRDLTNSQRILASFFHVMSSMTTVGFNSIPVGPLASSVLFLTVILMIIGASPAGTGGGLKSTTFVSVIGQIRSVISNKRDVRYWKQLIPADRVRQANATFAMYFGALFLGIYLLTLTENGSLMEIIFEAASALGTVGLSMDFTSELSIMGRIIVILLMLIGRVGPLTFGIAIFVKNRLIWDDSKTDLAI
jgi:trk system potassium uptake protein TrkH